MSTQTERPTRRPASQRGKTASGKRYHKQTAHVEARRDGKPLIFGWGKHLSRAEKDRLQRRGIWGIAALIVLILAAVIVGAWINLNIIVPGLTIASVNGHNIPQSQYRAMVAVNTQLELNKLYGPHGLTAQLTSLQTQDAAVNNTISQTNTQITNLQNQIKKLPAGPSTQRTDLTNQLTAAQKTLATNQTKHQTLQNQISVLTSSTIPTEKQNFTQSQVGNESMGWLQDDEILREWLTTQSAAVQAKINPTATQVNNDLKSLKANMPKTSGYNTFLATMGISDDTIRSMLTVVDRRNNAQTYFAPTVASPSYQVLARQIVLSTQQKANQILQDLQKGQDFGKLASNSQDTNTKTKGGDLGWMTRYQYIDSSVGISGSSVIENWMFDPARKLNEISPVLFGNGSYYIVQIMNIDPSRTVSSNVVTALKANALTYWLQDREALPGQHIVQGDQNMMFNDTNNLPPNNILPQGAPSSSNGQSGLPGQP